MCAQVLLSLGSNTGDRREALRGALREIAALPGTNLCASSHVYETEPIGMVDQPPFLNAAAAIETDLDPLELLAALKALEGRLGRETGPRWGPRVIDVDIVLWGGTVLEARGLTLPHASFRERAFVLAPLREIAPDAVDPVTGMTVAALAEAPEVQGAVEQLDLLTP